MQYQIVVDNKDVTLKLKKLADSLGHWESSMRAIGKAYKQYYATKPFASRGTVFGEQWPALKASYAAWKARKYPGAPILVRTGLMAKSFAFRAASDQVTLFNETDYFEKHQKGEGVPQRVSMALNDELELMAQDIIYKDLERKVNAV